jgi:hypothetical protein
MLYAHGFYKHALLPFNQLRGAIGIPLYTIHPSLEPCSVDLFLFLDGLIIVRHTRSVFCVDNNLDVCLQACCSSWEPCWRA